MSESKKQGTATIALILGIIGGVAPFTYFLMALGFLSVPGLILAILAFRRTKTSFSKISLAVNIVAVSVLAFFIIQINYNDYKSSKTVYQYYLPKGYCGWVIIKTKDKNANPIPVTGNSIGGIYKIIIPLTGKIETSDALVDWHKTEYFWYTEKDTVSFIPESGTWGNADYKSLIHCEGASSENYQHFYLSDKPRNPQDTAVLTACDRLFDELKKK